MAQAALSTISNSDHCSIAPRLSDGAAAIATPASSCDKGPDAKLIALCDRVIAHEKLLDKYAGDERDYDDIPECARSFRGFDNAVAKIVKMTAASLAGLQAKARVILMNDDYAGDDENYVKVAQSLARDLIVLDAVIPIPVK